MSRYEILIKPEDLEKHIDPILRENGFEIPPRTCYGAAVEFDENGEVVAYQMFQNAIFLEGLWSRDKNAHLRNLHNMALNAAQEMGAKRVMTMARQDEAGEKIGRLAEALGYEPMKWNVYRRKI